MTRLKAQAMDDGLQHYRVLALPRTAGPEQIKQEYRTLARRLHPDKGGSSEAFAALQAAFDVLSNPQTRKVYDALAADVRFRPGAAAPYSQVQQPDAAPSTAPGVTEALLLQQLLRARASAGGAVIDPAVQLCVTCEVCRRPATKECWTCGMAICDFCTRRQHWKGSVALHWPLVDSPGRLLQQLGQQELEAKRKEDGAAYLASLPGYRPQHDVQVLRQFQDAILDLVGPAPTAQQEQQQQQQQCNGSAKQGMLSTAAADSVSSSSSVIRCGTNSAEQKQPAVKHTGPAFALAANSSSIASCASTSSKSSSTAVVSTPSCDTALATTGSSKVLAATSNRSSANKCWRAWQAADAAVLRQLQGRYDVRLARFYMWAQTADAVLLAVHMPTGGTSHPPKLHIEVTASNLTLQHAGFAPMLHRYWAGAIDPAGGIQTWTSADGHTVALAVPKAQPGQNWPCCFKGDSHGARCLVSPYRLLQLPHEVQLELRLPFWVVPEEDLQVKIGERGSSVAVDGLLRLQRSYWTAADAKHNSRKVVDVPASSWCVLDEQQPQQQQSSSSPAGAAQKPQPLNPPASAAAGSAAAAATRQPRPGKLLAISLALPEPTQEERQYKKGVRQNNAAATRSCRHGHGKMGCAFFQDDEDEFGLASLLQALLFHETGETMLVPKPWELTGGAAAVECRWIDQEQLLPADVKQQLKFLRVPANEEGQDANSSDII